MSEPAPTLEKQVIALRDRGAAMHKQGKYDQAIADFNGAIQICTHAGGNISKKTIATLHALSSFSMLNRGDTKGALAAAEKAVEEDRHCELGYLRMVDALIKQKDYKQAVDVCRARVLELGSGYGVAGTLAAITGNDDKSKNSDQTNSSSNTNNNPIDDEDEDEPVLPAEAQQALEQYNSALESCYAALKSTGELKSTTPSSASRGSKAMRAQQTVAKETDSAQKKQQAERPADYCTHGAVDPRSPEGQPIKEFFASWFVPGKLTLCERANAKAEQNNSDKEFWQNLSNLCAAQAANAAVYGDFGQLEKLILAAIYAEELARHGVAAVKEYVADTEMKVSEQKNKPLFELVDRIRKGKNEDLVNYLRLRIPCRCL